MTVAQIKSEINNVIEHIPENALEDALKLLKDFQERSESDDKIDFFFKQVVDENGKLLERLAK